jgi:parallel beta-helix repeat protein
VVIRNNDIFGNSISGTTFRAFWMDSSSNNRIYHNNLDLTKGIYSVNSTNIWDDGYPSGGNHWSNYHGVDANADGIGDNPYVIYSNNMDNYPLMAHDNFDE